MKYEIIETEKCVIKIYSETPYLEYSIKEGASINEEDVLEYKKKVVNLRPGTKFYVLAEGIEFFTISQKAREICATKKFSDNTIAIAFYSTNISVLLLGEMYNKINKLRRKRLFKNNI
ncbi:MAG: DUF7793 family protein, partial [Bacteroidia bacterium]